MASLLAMFGPFAAKFALSILDAVLQKNKADQQAQAAYLALTQAMAANGLIAVSLHNSYAEQQAANKAKAAEEYYRLHPEERPPPPASPQAGNALLDFLKALFSVCLMFAVILFLAYQLIVHGPR